MRFPVYSTELSIYLTPRIKPFIHSLNSSSRLRFVLVAHAAEQPALLALFLPMFFEVSFGFVDEIRDGDDFCVAILVRPVERHRIFRGATPPTLLADAHPKFLGVNDLSPANY